jgi:hypothetical protein
MPPQLLCVTPRAVSTWHFTAQFFSAVSPLSVTTSIDAPSGAMTQAARAATATHPSTAASATVMTDFMAAPSPRHYSLHEAGRAHNGAEGEPPIAETNAPRSFRDAALIGA